MPPSLAGFQLLLFGRPSLSAYGQEVLGPGKPIFVLAYLACRRWRRAARGRVIDLLWDDVPPEQGRRGLRQAILQLQRRVNANLIVEEGNDLVLAVGVHVDRDQFLDAIEMESWGEAARRAGAPFLADAAAPGGEAFERWAGAERRHGRDLVEIAVDQAVRAALAAGDTVRALTTVSNWRDADPTHEPTWQHLIATALEAGDLPRARLEAHWCIAALAEQARSPAPMTQELLIRAGTDVAVGGSPNDNSLLRPELVGRTELFAKLVAAQRDAVRGKARRVLLSSRPGLGKTRLLEALSERLSGKEVEVTTIRATPTMQSVQGGVLAELVLALGQRRGATRVSAASARVLIAVAPDLAVPFASSLPVTDWAPATRKVSAALEELLLLLAEDRPQVLLFDDLQWWDSLTEVTVCDALARCTAARLLVVATSRRLHPAFPSDATHTLTRLTAEDVESLLQSLADAEGPLLDLIAPPLQRASHGVPLLALEALYWLIEQRALRLHEGRWELLDEAVLTRLQPETLLFDERFATLDAAAARIVRWLAVSEQPLPQTLFGHGALDRHLVDGGFVRLSNGALSLGHETIGERAIQHELEDNIRTIRIEIARALLGANQLPVSQLRLAGQLAAKAKHAELAGMAFDRWTGEQSAHVANLAAAWAAFLGLTPPEAQALGSPKVARGSPWKWLAS